MPQNNKPSAWGERNGGKYSKPVAWGKNAPDNENASIEKTDSIEKQNAVAENTTVPAQRIHEQKVSVASAHDHPKTIAPETEEKQFKASVSKTSEAHIDSNENISAPDVVGNSQVSEIRTSHTVSHSRQKTVPKFVVPICILVLLIAIACLVCIILYFRNSKGIVTEPDNKGDALKATEIVDETIDNNEIETNNDTVNSNTIDDSDNADDDTDVTSEFVNETVDENLTATLSVAEWKQLYLDYIKSDVNYEDNYGEYALIYVDSDDVPELFHFMPIVSIPILCVINDGEVQEYRIDYGGFYAYLERQGFFKGGNYVFELKNGRLMLLENDINSELIRSIDPAWTTFRKYLPQEMVDCIECIGEDGSGVDFIKGDPLNGEVVIVKGVDVYNTPWGGDIIGETPYGQAYVHFEVSYAGDTWLFVKYFTSDGWQCGWIDRYKIEY